MINTFKQMEEIVLNSHKKSTIALCGAHDDYSLNALLEAKHKGLCECVLIGDAYKIEELLKKANEEVADYRIIDCKEEDASLKAVELIHKGEADIPMKGMMQTSDFMHPILNKETGLLEKGNIVSQITVAEYKKENRFFVITDCAININPDLERKVQIINNATIFTKKIGIKKAKVAALSALEVVNPKMPSTVDADLLRQKSDEGLFKDCVVYGPLAFDNAISKEAAKHKRINSEVAGCADIILVPEIVVGNALTKSLIFFSDLKLAGTFVGTKTPIIGASRTDTLENKYRAILLGLFLGLKD